MQTEISLLLRNRCDNGLHSCHSVCTLSSNCNDRLIIVGQGPAVLAAGTGLKLSDFLGVFFLFERVFFSRKLNGEIFLFWHFSVRYNVSFIKIIRISMPHRLNVFFSFFFFFS